MSADDRFGQALAAWLEEEARHRVPDHLSDVLARSAATRQRPWWSRLDWLLPMTPRMGVRGAPRRTVLLATLVVLLAGVVGLALVAGAQRSAPAPAPFGLAPNGRIYFVDAMTIRSVAADGTNPVDVYTTTSAAPFALSVSPDGTRLAFASGPSGASTLTVLDLETRKASGIPSPRDVAVEPIGWSPDGTQLIFAGSVAGEWRVVVVRSDGTGEATTPGTGRTDAIGGSRDVWQPQFSPDGSWIAFLSRPIGSPVGTADGDIWVMHPDGADLHRVAGNASTPGPVWAPDPHVQRLMYQAADGPTLLDLPDGHPVTIGPGFWSSWSPDGSRIAYWHDGPAIVRTEDVLAGVRDPARPFGTFTENCPDRPDLTGRAICSPIVWSPDGRSVIGSDIVASALLIAPADGSGPVRTVPVGTGTGPDIHAAWQPLRP